MAVNRTRIQECIKVTKQHYMACHNITSFGVIRAPEICWLLANTTRDRGQSAGEFGTAGVASSAGSHLNLLGRHRGLITEHRAQKITPSG